MREGKMGMPSNMQKCPYCGSDDVSKIKSDASRMRCLECGEAFEISETLENVAFKPLKLFMSYGHPEIEIVRKIKQSLEDRGHKVWIDESEIKAGHDWREKISDGVRSSNGVVACLSSHSVRNPGVCLDELAIAVGIHGGNVKTVLLGSEQEVNPPASVAHVQWVDMHDWRERLENDPNEFGTWFERKMLELFESIESDDSYSFIREMGGIRNALQPIVDNSKQQELLNRAFFGREWLTKRVISWLDDEESPGVCLLIGSPGVGKSAFAAHFAHYGSHMRSCVAAAIFCEANRPRYNDSSQVLKTLAYLLACRIPEYRIDLARVVRERRDLSEMNEDELFAFLLADPLTRSINGNHEHLCIIVDGLDEVGDSDTNALAEAFGRYAKRLPNWLKILIVSRQVSSTISPLTSGAKCINIDDYSDHNLDDVRSFLYDAIDFSFSSDPGYHDSIETIVKLSEGTMLYAAVIADAINKGKATLESACLESPKDLASTFHQWFIWTFPNKNDFITDFREPLGCVLAAPDGVIPVYELRRIFKWSRNQASDFTRRLETFLQPRVTSLGEEALTISHSFLREWIASEDAGGFLCSLDDGREKLAYSYYSFMNKGLDYLTDYEICHMLDLFKMVGLEHPYERTRNSPDFLSRIVNLCAAFEMNGKLTEAEMLVRNMMAHFRDANNLPKVCWADFLAYASHLEERLNNFFGSAKLCQSALVVYKELSKADANLYLPRIASQYAKLAGLLFETSWIFRKDDFQWLIQSERHYREALCIYRQLIESDESYLEGLATTCDDLAKMLSEDGRFDEAESLYREALCIYRQLIESDESYLEGLAATCDDLAKMLSEDGRFDEAESLYREALQVVHHLADSDPSRSQFEVAAICNDLGEFFLNKGNHSEAEIYINQASEAISRLKEIELNAHLPTLACIYHNRARLSEAKKLISDAEELYRKGLSIWEKLAFGSLSNQMENAVNYFSLANLMLSDGRQKEALQFFHEAIDICEDYPLCRMKKLTDQITSIIAENYGEDVIHSDDVYQDYEGEETNTENAELSFFAVDDMGKETEYNVLCMFESFETGKNYIVYSDYSIDCDGDISVFASAYNPASLNAHNTYGILELIPIETEKEWQIIDSVLEELQERVSEESENSCTLEDGRISQESHNIIQVGFAEGIFDDK